MSFVISSSMEEFGSPQRALLLEEVARLLKCLGPVCKLHLSVIAASLLLEIVALVANTDSQDDARAEFQDVEASAEQLAAMQPAALSSTLGVQVSTGVSILITHDSTMLVAVAPPPPAESVSTAAPGDGHQELSNGGAAGMTTGAVVGIIAGVTATLAILLVVAHRKRCHRRNDMANHASDRNERVVRVVPRPPARTSTCQPSHADKSSDVLESLPQLVELEGLQEASPAASDASTAIPAYRV